MAGIGAIVCHPEHLELLPLDKNAVTQVPGLTVNDSQIDGQMHGQIDGQTHDSGVESHALGVCSLSGTSRAPPPSTRRSLPRQEGHHFERFSHLSATDRYEIMNNGSNADHFWRGFEVQFLVKKPKAEEPEPLFAIRSISNCSLSTKMSLPRSSCIFVYDVCLVIYDVCLVIYDSG